MMEQTNKNPLENPGNPEYVNMYRVFKLDMTYFEVQDGQLKLTFKLKKR